MRLTACLACIAVGAIYGSFGSVRPAAADGPAVTAGAVVMAKKHRAFAAKVGRAKRAGASSASKARWRRSLDKRIGKKPPALINVYNGWTHEYVAVAARGRRAELSANEVNRFLRCRYTNESTSMDARLLATVVAAARHFRVGRADIISAYRSPKYNLILRKKGRQVARASRHTMGKAIDFRLPGVSTKRLHAWAVRQAAGGVGKYTQSEFIHMDTDKIRYWEGR